MDLYAENILDHYRHPRNKKLPSPLGRGDGGLPRIGANRLVRGEGFVTHEEVNLSCGDALMIQLRIEKGRIAEVGWEGSGCAISQAAMSMLSEELAGKSLQEIDALAKEDIYGLLGVPIGPRRVKCALLCLHALKNALGKFHGEATVGWGETIGGA